MYFLPWPIVLLLHNLGVTIFLVHVGAFLVLGALINVVDLGCTVELRYQCFLFDNIYNQVLCHSIGHWSNQLH